MSEQTVEPQIVRGKDRNTKEWVYGWLVVAEDCVSKDAQFVIITKATISFGCRFDYQFPIPETVGRYTGKKDKDENRIFEGDAVTSYQNDDQPVVVYWDEDLREFVTSNYHSTLSLDFSMSKDDKLVGNIHDNPEFRNL